MALYKALVDCMCFEKFRAEGEEFDGPDYKDHYGWEVPEHIEVLESDKPKRSRKITADSGSDE